MRFFEDANGLVGIGRAEPSVGALFPIASGPSARNAAGAPGSTALRPQPGLVSEQKIGRGPERLAIEKWIRENDTTVTSPGGSDAGTC